MRFKKKTSPWKVVATAALVTLLAIAVFALVFWYTGTESGRAVRRELDPRWKAADALEEMAK